MVAQPVNAEIISIGTEILLGELTDTNSVHIARALRDIGVSVYFMVSVGDNQGRIAEAIRIALNRADIVITTGGLGPTVDDMTRQAVTAATERGLTFHPALFEKIAARFASFRVQMTENNKQQAYLPDEAIPIENPVGTAPGFIVEHQGKLVISLPGVPREMKYLLSENVIPFLRQRYNLGVIRTHILRAAGIGESALDALIGKDLLESSNPTVGLGAHSGVVDIRITARADTPEQAERTIAEMEQRVRARVGMYIFGTGKDTIQNALVQELLAHGAALAVSECGTRGTAAQLIREVEGSGAVLGYVSLYDSLRDFEKALPELEGLPIREQAAAAAERLCREHDALVGLAIISDPDQVEDHADTEAGTAVAVYVGGQTRSRVYGFGAQIDMIRTWASNWGLATAWRMLREHGGE